MTGQRIILLGGPHDRSTAEVSSQPPRICVVARALEEPVTYVRVDDPDTGEPLGAYVWEGAPCHLVPVGPTR